ncbi:putative exonuclease [Bacillus phage BPS10C]|uniref:Putative exonuclease n=1 Tax=Bacillus phage BPS10C TaxID=1277886 RepID=W5QUL3_9CAUD|nr:exonuclease [Bacillus phage BPS10C]AGI12223.1 putative exonuclease [Bacillus phage BPS10C]
MIWEKLIVKNFLAINDAEIPLENQGLILIEGENKSDDKFESNGAGKSSLVSEPIRWVLYNKISKGGGSDDVVNDKVGKDTEVTLIGRDGDDRYEISRYRKHSKYANKVLVYRNGVNITEKSNAGTDALIEQIVGVSHLTFINSILFAQGEGIGSFASLTDSKKKEILDSVLKLDVYSTAQQIAKDAVSATEKKIDDKKKEKEKLQWELSQVDVLEQNDRANYESTKNNIINGRKQLELAVKALNDYPAANFGFIEKDRDRKVELEKQLAEVSNIDMSKEEDNVAKVQDILNKFSNKDKELTMQKNNLLKNYKSLDTTDTCPVCGSAMDITHVTTEQNNIKTEVAKVMAALKQLEQKGQPYVALMTKASAALDAKRKEQREVVNVVNDIQRQISDIDKRVRDYEHQLQMLKNNKDAVVSRLEMLQETPEPKPRTAERKKWNDAIAKVDKEIIELEKEKLEDEDVVKVFSNDGVKSHVLDLITPELNKKGNEFLKRLAGENMELKFTTRTQKKDKTYSDKFDVQVTNRVGGKNYKLASGGEKKRADLAISLAIHDLVAHYTNFVVADEFFDALDEKGIESSIDVLSDIADKVGTVFVITQSSHFKSLFEKVITVTKDSTGISKIKTEERKK